jgi:hypothetical protein
LVVWGLASTSCWHWLSKNLTGISLSVDAGIPTDIQVHFVDELATACCAAAAANAVCDAVGSEIRRLRISRHFPVIHRA